MVTACYRQNRQLSRVPELCKMIISFLGGGIPSKALARGPKKVDGLTCTLLPAKSKDELSNGMKVTPKEHAQLAITGNPSLYLLSLFVAMDSTAEESLMAVTSMGTRKL